MPGGAARDLLCEIDWELRHGYEVHVAVGAGSEIHALPAAVKVHLLSTLVRDLNPSADLRAAWQVRRLLRRYCFDIVHTHQSKAGILGRLAACGTGSIIVHTILMASFGPGYSPAASLVFCLAERICARFTDFLLPVGEDLKRAYLEAGVGRREQYTVIRSPIDIEAFAATRLLGHEERVGMRKRFGLPRRGHVIAAAGLLEPRKRFGFMIRRLAPLLAARGAMLVIAGQGPEETALKSLVSRLGLDRKVRLVGFIDNLPELFAVANVFVHTSSAEGVPQVVIQASAAGLPVVATDVEGLDEILDGVTMVVARDGHDLANAVNSVVVSRREPIDLSALAPWLPEQVQTQLSEFHDRLWQALVRKNNR